MADRTIEDAAVTVLSIGVTLLAGASGWLALCIISGTIGVFWGQHLSRR